MAYYKDYEQVLAYCTTLQTIATQLDTMSTKLSQIGAECSNQIINYTPIDNGKCGDLSSKLDTIASSLNNACSQIRSINEAKEADAKMEYLKQLQNDNTSQVTSNI